MPTVRKNHTGWVITIGQNCLNQLLPFGVEIKLCTSSLKWNRLVEDGKDNYLDESFSNHGVLADGAEEALVVPGQGLEGHELGAAETSFA